MCPLSSSCNRNVEYLRLFSLCRVLVFNIVLIGFCIHSIEFQVSGNFVFLTAPPYRVFYDRFMALNVSRMCVCVLCRHTYTTVTTEQIYVCSFYGTSKFDASLSVFHPDGLGGGGEFPPPPKFQIPPKTQQTTMLCSGVNGAPLPLNLKFPPPKVKGSGWNTASL